MLKQFKFVSAAFALMICLSLAAFGQGRAGDIDGTVTDSTGAVIPGATVTLESTGSTTGLKRTVSSNDSGYFIFASISPGTYKVTVAADNFSNFEKSVSVTVDKTTSVSAKLAAAGQSVTVDVNSDSAVTVDLGSTKIDTSISKEIINSLPRGTNFTSLLKIAPNVRPEAAAGGLQIDGASGSENVFVIDGQEVTNFRSGVLDSNNNLPFELLQEVQIKSTGFEAEYGGATGGVINAVTAGGNNEFRGLFGTSFRVQNFQGRPNTVLNAYGSGAGQFEYFQPRKDGGTDFFPVASLSGPILKDRVWFKVDYAPQLFETTRTVDYFGDPDPATRAVQTSAEFANNVRREYSFGRIDAQPLDNLRVFGTFLWNPVIQDGELGGQTEGLNVAAPNLTPAQRELRGGRRNSNSYNYQATYNPLSWMVLNFRNGRSFQNEKIGSYGIIAQQRFAISSGSAINPCNPLEFGWNGGSIDFCRGFNTGSNSVLVFDVSTRTTYDVDASFVGVEAGGRHNIKVGYQLNQLFNDVDSGYTSLGYMLLYFGPGQFASRTGGSPGLPDCPDFLNVDAAATNCSLGAARMVRLGTAGQAKSDNTGLFVQDSWQVADRLTLNFGVRVENEVVPSFGDPTTTTDIEFGWGDKVAPRFGAAFDLTGDGKTKIFGSYGWFYDRFKYELPRGLFGGQVWLDAWADITPARGISPFNYTFANMLGGRPLILGGECPIAAPTGFATCERDNRVPSNAVGADPFAGAGAVDPNLEAMRQSEYTFGFERELGNNFVLAGRFTHKQLDQAIEDIGSFNAQGSEAYVIGNPGQGLACDVAQAGNFPCTEAERTYDAVEVRLDKRTAKYFFNGTYTWSRLFGNYSGLASSDELGRNSPNVNRFFDLPMLGYNADGAPDNGLLGTDRTHVFKAYGGYTFDWQGNGTSATTVSAFTTMQSGTPLTTVYSLYNVSTSVLFERGDLGRTEMFSETDLFISHKYKFGRDNRVSLEPFLEIRNLFNERNVLGVGRSFGNVNIVGTNLETGGCPDCVVRDANGNVNIGLTEGASLRRIFNGGIQQFVLNYLNDPTVTQSRLSNTYQQPNSFQGGRDVRFGFRVVF